jgi:hypothetical protein
MPAGVDTAAHRPDRLLGQGDFAVACRAPGQAKATFSLEVVGRYRLLIRRPSGRIGRGWSAAIDRQDRS